MSKRLLLCIAAALLTVNFASVAWASIGDLSQKDGTAGCISTDGSGGECVDGVALGTAQSVAISPDGENAYVTSLGNSAVTIFNRDPATGTLTQKPGEAGCIGGGGPDCADGAGLGAAQSVAVSPDGENVYVTSYNVGAVAIFERDPEGGALTQLPGKAACIGYDFFDECTEGVELEGAWAVVVSPDGDNVYVGTYTSNGVAIFDRDEESGALTQKPDEAGCITDSGSEGECTDGVGLDHVRTVVISPDGDNVYAAGFFSSAIAIFDRDAGGALKQKPGTAGCISEKGLGPCAEGLALHRPNALAISPKGEHVYATANAGITTLNRDPTSGGLTEKGGSTAACISSSGASPCTAGKALGGANFVAISPDGAHAYVTASSSDTDAVTVFNRDPASGVLTQSPGCVSETGAGPCADGKALDGPNSVAISPDGRNAYVTSASSGAVAIFDRDLVGATPPVDEGNPPAASPPAAIPTPPAAKKALKCKKGFKKKKAKGKERCARVKKKKKRAPRG